VQKESLTVSQREVLLGLPSRVPVERIDRLWLFQPQHGREGESGLIVLSLLPEEPLFSPQRRLLTLRYRAEPARGRLRREETLAEEGRAPPERIERVIAGVLARIGETAGEPVAEAIEGSPALWAAFLQRLGISI